MNPPKTEAQQRERISVQIVPHADAASAELARQIAALIRARSAEGRTTVLGLATGSTPVRLYRELIRLHRETGLSFQTVITFNLDEYYGLPRTHPESYWRFMHEQLFNHIDLPAENIHVPDGTVPRAGIYAWCRQYEEKIISAGGLDLQVLGIGRTGHIGFNEPGSSRDSRTRLVTLDRLTRGDAARDFLGEANVPRHAITMGIGTILDARQVVLLAWGASKAEVIARAVEGLPDESLPASLLQQHPNLSFLIDEAAAGQLVRRRQPWLVGPVEWSPKMVRRAIGWLARKLNKPVLKLVDEDYSEHGLADLLTEQGPAYGLNIRIFNELQQTITGWPGGKPHADDTRRPERNAPFPKRVLVLSPEPSADVIGMGGTLRRLVEQGHETTVVYLTSGNLAVPDEEAAMAAELVADLARDLNDSSSVLSAFVENVRQQLGASGSTAPESAYVRRIKSILRRNEARASLNSCGISSERIKFIDLGFYERGRYRQFHPDPRDLTSLTQVLREIQPHQVFSTGQQEDPSSLAAVCFELLRQSLAQTKREPWQADCRVWLHRGGSSVWDLADIDMAVPFSPPELARKIHAIYQHKSQRSQAIVATGFHESWQQAEQQNRALAKNYDQLGLAEYEALEAFERYDATA
jgi:glucosamine-6-phosphate deaminase